MVIIVHFLIAVLFACIAVTTNSDGNDSYEGKVVKGNRNALYLVKNGKRSQFPDFYTFVQMGYNLSVIKKIDGGVLDSIPIGEMIKPIAVYRPEDFMYHRVCSDADRMVQELGLIPNMGNLMSYLPVLQRVKSRKSVEVLALGGSITAGGYFMEFVRTLEEKEGFRANIHNHGHGATEIQCQLVLRCCVVFNLANYFLCVLVFFLH
jgi:hypothetical protein